MTLTTLKLTDAKKPRNVAPVIVRRRKLELRVWQQIELAKAQQTGASYTIKRFRSYTDKTTGARMQIETDVRVKPWWFVTDGGKLAISVRYGSRVLKLLWPWANLTHRLNWQVDCLKKVLANSACVMCAHKYLYASLPCYASCQIAIGQNHHLR